MKFSTGVDPPLHPSWLVRPSYLRAPAQDMAYLSAATSVSRASLRTDTSRRESAWRFSSALRVLSISSSFSSSSTRPRRREALPPTSATSLAGASRGNDESRLLRCPCNQIGPTSSHGKDLPQGQIRPLPESVTTPSVKRADKTPATEQEYTALAIDGPCVVEALGSHPKALGPLCPPGSM